MPKREIKNNKINKKMSKAELEQALIDNFINLQKVLTNLSVKFDDLSSKMSQLLELFEISAKSFAEKHPEAEVPKEDKKLLEKLDALLNQNKTIAKGILLMEDKIRQRAMPQKSPMNLSRHSRPLPRM